MNDANNLPQTQERGWPLIVGTIVGAVVLLLLLRSCLHQPAADPELARATQQAVAMADRMQRDNDAAFLAASRFRLLGIVLGCSIPLVVVAVLIICLAHRDRGCGQPPADRAGPPD